MAVVGGCFFDYKVHILYHMAFKATECQYKPFKPLT